MPSFMKGDISMKYLLFCDMNTVQCSPATLEKVISENSNAYLRITDNLWVFDATKISYAFEFQSVPDYYINVLLDNYLVENSICFVFEANDSNSCCNFPNNVCDFLTDDKNV